MSTVQCKSCGHDNPPEAHFCANCGANLETATEQPVPSVAPGIEPVTETAVEYMGFWIRFGAWIIDYIIVTVITVVLSLTTQKIGSVFGLLINWLYLWLFTGLRGQTLGKMAFGIKVVNAGGSVPGLGDAALREIAGKIVSSIVVCLGFLWIAWDGRKQGWHDKIASTQVVRADSRR